jgi:hypothetical protein
VGDWRSFTDAWSAVDSPSNKRPSDWLKVGAAIEYQKRPWNLRKWFLATSSTSTAATRAPALAVRLGRASS